MRFLRESAVERVHAGADDAARDQQGDLRRMSVLDWLMTPPPDVAIEIDARARRPPPASSGAAAGPSWPRTRWSRCRRAPSCRRWRRPTCTDVGVGRAGRQASARRSSADAPHAWRWWCPTPWRRCRCCASTRCRPRQPTCARSSAGRSARARRSRWSRPCSASAPARRRPRAARSSSSRSRARTWFGSTEQACAMAGVHAGIVDLATFSIINSVVAGGGAHRRRLAAGARGRHLHHAGGDPGQHVIFFRHRSEESEGTLADLVHQTAMYYEDRLKGAGFSRVLLAGRRSMPAATSCGATSRSGLAPASSAWTRGPRPISRIASAPSPELDDALAPLVGVLLREREGRLTCCAPTSPRGPSTTSARSGSCSGSSRSWCWAWRPSTSSR